MYALRKDIKDYVRRIRLKEYFYAEDDVEGDFSEFPAFRKKSVWTPEKSRELAIEAYVEALERELLSHNFDASYQRNLTKDEQIALKNLRSYDDIIIKQADKGSAVVVMDKEAYLTEAMKQLDDTEIYQPLVKDPTKDMIKKVNARIKESYQKGNIDKDTQQYLLASGEERAGRFYLLPKIHKAGCPGRPVISGCNTPTEKISKFVDHHLRPLVLNIESYIKDTNDFLRKLKNIGTLPDGAILCTIDVVGLYPHIPHDEGLQAVREALGLSNNLQSDQMENGDLRQDIVDFTELVLKNNNFEFNGGHYVQKLGTAIGTRMAPSYANIFMDKLERQLISNALIKPHTWWRFIDDIFIVWTEGEESLKEFIDYLNAAHRTIKFTSKWSYSEIEFLDVKVINDSGKLETDVYIKPTDSHQYLHRTSCHPNACKKGIPFAQALRLRRICSKDDFFNKRADDLCTFLVERGYKKHFVQEQVERARNIPRHEVLRDKEKKENKRIPFTVTYHPGLPNIGGVLRDLHPVLQSSKRCKDAIKEVPMVAFRKPKSLSDYLVRARFTTSSNQEVKGTCKCNSNRCQICNFLSLGRSFHSHITKKEFSINYNLDCNSNNVVYLISCKKCNIQYVGSTTTKFRTRFNNHKSRITSHVSLTAGQKKKDDLIYQHFNSEGHSGLMDMSVQLIDCVREEKELREKEGFWIYKLKTISPNGLNDNDCFYVQNRKTRTTARVS